MFKLIARLRSVTVENSDLEEQLGEDTKEEEEEDEEDNEGEDFGSYFDDEVSLFRHPFAFLFYQTIPFHRNDISYIYIFSGDRGQWKIEKEVQEIKKEIKIQAQISYRGCPSEHC